MLAALEIVITTLVVFLFWKLAARQPPLAVLRAALWRVTFDPRYRLPFLWLLALLVADLIETQFDDALTARLGYDMTRWIHRLEGDLAGTLLSLGAAFAAGAFRPRGRPFPTSDDSSPNW